MICPSLTWTYEILFLNWEKKTKNIKYLTNQLRIELFSMLKAFAMTARIKLFLKA